MELLPVYSLLPIELVRGSNTTVWDADGNAYLDLYGGHAVISVGHARAAWATAIAEQAATLGYYSNSVRIRIQEEAAEALGRIAGRPDYRAFFVNSGAEANENAMKLASFATGRPRIIAFDKAFHGRTSLAVAATDNPKIVAPVNETPFVTHVPLNDIDAVRTELAKGDVAGVIIESIQGVGGCRMPTDAFLRELEALCTAHGTLLILDEVQAGCGRSGRYFGFDHTGINPPLITMAKGIGNGFPVGAVLVHPDIEVTNGMLGTTFGGNHMACAAVKSVVEIIESDGLMQNAAERGQQIIDALKVAPHITEVRGRGLMLGIVLDQPSGAVRTALWKEHGILTGNASDPNVLRILPPLTLSAEEAEQFTTTLTTILTELPA